MYAEIKSSDKILINRLDENEQILLEDMYRKGTLPHTILELEKLTDESGDFGGVMLNFNVIDNKDIEIITEIPKSITLQVGDIFNLTVETNIVGVIPTIYYKSTDNTVIYINENFPNGFSFTAEKITTEPLTIYYTIAAKGYNTVNGSIELSVEAKSNQLVIFNAVNEEDEPITNFSTTITDGDSTQYVVTTSEQGLKYAELPKGTYHIVIIPTEVDKYQTYESDLVISNEMLSKPDVVYFTADILNKEVEN